MSTSFARDYHMHGEIAATRDGRILGLRAKVLADHGAFNATAQPTKFPAGFFHIFTGSYDLRAAHCQVTGGVHQQGAGRGRLLVLVPHHRGGVPGRADGGPAGRRAGHGPGRAADEEPAAARAVPLHRPTGWEYDSGDYPRALRAGHGHRRLPGAAPGAGGEAGARRVMGIGISFFTEGGRRGAAQAHGHPRPGHGRRRRPAGAPDRQGGAGDLGARPRARATRRRSPRSSPRSWACPPDDVEVVHGDTDRTPFGLGTYGSRSTPVSGAAAAVVARKVRERARIVAAAMLEVSAGRPGVDRRPLAGARRPGAGQDASRRSRWRRTPRWSCPRGCRGTWTPAPSTTRRT